MIELTEDIELGEENDNLYHFRLSDCFPDIKQQLLDDYRKARTYEEIEKVIPEMYKDWKSILPKIKQDQKLCELIEKREEECRTNSNKINFAEQFKEYSYQERVGVELEKLLTESKK